MLVFLLAVCIIGQGSSELLSLNKPTSASSIAWGGTNEGAVNGNTEGSFSSGQCSHSSETSGNWWQVDLLNTAAIDIVKLYNRVDCCSERIDGVEVFVGDELCGTVAYVSGQYIYEFDCGGMEGDFVRVEQDTNYLTLCEVQVYGEYESESELLSLNQPTSSSSIAWGGTNEGAVNGNTEGSFTDGQCSHSSGTTNEWWQVDLENSASIDRVVIYNRVDCCSERINGVEVFINTDTSSQLCGEVVYVSGQSVYVIECGGRVGDYVRVENDNNYLTLCEVQVYGEVEEESSAWDTLYTYTISFDNAWRDDGRCGPDYLNAAGTDGECNPVDPGGYTCCSPYGWCGKTADHCDCDTCIDYSEEEEEDDD